MKDCAPCVDSSVLTFAASPSHAAFQSCCPVIAFRRQGLAIWQAMNTQGKLLSRSRCLSRALSLCLCQNWQRFFFLRGLGNRAVRGSSSSILVLRCIFTPSFEEMTCTRKVPCASRLLAIMVGLIAVSTVSAFVPPQAPFLQTRISLAAARASKVIWRLHSSMTTNHHLIWQATNKLNDLQ